MRLTEIAPAAAVSCSRWTAEFGYPHRVFQPRAATHLIASAVLCLSPASSLFPRPPERSISTSRQFIIYGTNVRFRGAISDLAERTKAELLRILQQRDNWKTPIIINLQLPQANLPEVSPSELRFSQTGFGLKLQLDLTMNDAADCLGIQREVLRATLLEMIYRRQTDIAAGATFVQAPEWLLEGLLLMVNGTETSPLIDAIAPIISSSKILTMEELLRKKPANLDTPAKSLYRAYAFAFLQFLLEQPSGPSRLANYIGSLSDASSDQFGDLNSRFGALAEGDSEAAWRSFLTKFASAGTQFRLLTFNETTGKLDELLHVRVRNAAGAAKELRWDDLLRRTLEPNEAAALHTLNQNLAVLTASAHPVLWPVIVEYEQIAQLLARGKRAGIAQRLVRLQSTRSKLADRMQQIDDYMNWFEATQLKTSSGAFSSYLKTASQSSDTRRHDPLSVYLDAIELQFEN